MNCDIARAVQIFTPSRAHLGDLLRPKRPTKILDLRRKEWKILSICSAQSRAGSSDPPRPCNATFLTTKFAGPKDPAKIDWIFWGKFSRRHLCVSASGECLLRVFLLFTTSDTPAIETSTFVEVIPSNTEMRRTTSNPPNPDGGRVLESENNGG